MADIPEYFQLRPDVERAYGYTHGVRIGSRIKTSGAVSMDAAALKHYGCTFDDVVVEDVFTTNMAEFVRVAGYQSTIYTKQFPTGTWLEVKGLALPEFLIEIELEAHRSA